MKDVAIVALALTALYFWHKSRKLEENNKEVFKLMESGQLKYAPK